MSEAEALNQTLAEGCPPASALLSALGRSMYFPKGIPFQAAQARGTRYNATIGEVTDGRGQPMPIGALEAPLSGLDARMSHLYSPPAGHPALRDAWARRQRAYAGGSLVPTTRPFVALGLTHAVSLAAELFVDAGTPVLVPRPRWGNYDQVFGVRRLGRLVPYDLFIGGRWDPSGLAEAAAAVQGPSVLILNFPNNPTGFSPSAADVPAIVNAALAGPYPRMVLVDDAYLGMNYAEGLPERSLFWDLAEAADPARHLVARADGVTKELLFFPGRVGFLTFALDPAGPVAAALESKLAGLVRSILGSPPGPSQALVLHALNDPTLEAQIQGRRGILAERARVLTQALAGLNDPGVRVYPFNSGVFALVGLDPSLPADEVRRHLIETESLGLVAEDDNALRIAYCSVDVHDIPELVSRLGRGLSTFRARFSDSASQAPSSIIR
jgi:aspartate/methionine/tyrosine aminotransferase